MLRRITLLYIVTICVLFTLAGCGNENPSLSDYEQSTTGQSILSALEEAGITDYKAIETPKGETLKKLDEAIPENFYYRETYHFNTKTESGKRLGIIVKEKQCIGIVDYDTDNYYYCAPSYYTETDGTVVEYYTNPVYSYTTGELIKSWDRDKETRALDLQLQESKERAEASFVERMTSKGFSSEEADVMYEVLDSVGVSSSYVSGDIDGNMGIFRAIINGHQVNITTENNRVFYVQITGFEAEKLDWYINWRGKLKYRTTETETQFDLYDDASGGYLARYDSQTDSIVPWGQ